MDSVNYQNGAKVLLFFDICKFFSEKMCKMVKKCQKK